MSIVAEVSVPDQLAAGSFRLAAILGQPSPSRPGYCPVRASSASVNDAGEVVFVADTAGPASASAIVHLDSAGDTRVLVRAGEPAPGGGKYASFGEVDLGDGGRVLFQARLAGCEAAEGVFLRTGSGVQLVAWAGESAPGGGHYARFRQLSLASWPRAAAVDVRLSYVARTTDGRMSLVIWPYGRGPCRVMTTGTRVAGGILEDFTTSRLGLAVCVVARIRYGVTKRRVALLASEDQLSGEEQLRDGGRLPGVGGIARLIAPPAVSLHHGHVAVALDDGGQALATRPAGGEVRVLGRNGEPAPGRADQRITKFGPPTANSGLPGGKYAVASVVQLSGGRTALWVGGPGSPSAIRLVAGDHAAGDPAVRVDSFTPVKLTDTGILLLRSMVDLGGRAAEGLLVIDRIFG